MNILKDKFILAAFAGVVGNTVRAIVDYIAYSLKITDIMIWQGAASAFIMPEKIQGFFAILVGFLADYTVAVAMSLLILFVIEQSGFHYPIAKGIFGGLIFWVLVYGILSNTTILKLKPEQAFVQFYYSLNHFGLGGIIGWIINRYGKNLLKKS